MLRDALWETGNTINQSHILWHDPSPRWAAGVAYRWRILHDPDSGRIRVRWYEVSALRIPKVSCTIGEMLLI